MKCYLCGSNSSTQKEGRVRDNSKLKILECCVCGLVYLDSNDHIKDEFYEQSNMHKSNLNQDRLLKIEEWLKLTELDDQRRFEMIKNTLVNKSVLDFGCGAGGFLRKSQRIASKVFGIELEERVRKYWESEITIFKDVNSLKNKFDLKENSIDVITSFHVLEHLKDPMNILLELKEIVKQDGIIIIEVPNSNDALLTMYESKKFQEFSYWSQHLYLFNSGTIKLLAKKAGLKLISLKHIQRYPLSNHLFWLSKGKPGGHQKWEFLDSVELSNAYENALSKIGLTDTIIAFLKPI